MDNPSIWDFGSDIFKNGFLAFVIYTCAVLVIVSIISRLIRRLFKNKFSPQAQLASLYIQKVITALLYVIAVFSIFEQIKMLQGLSITLLGATSVLTVIVGLAAQETFGNFISGFFIAIFQPFQVGDTVALPEKDTAGRVEQITFRHTVLRTVENTKLIIPNKVMDGAVVENRAYGQAYFKRMIHVTVGYDSDPQLVMQLIREAVMSVPEFLDLRTEAEIEEGAEPFVIRLDEFGASGLDFGFYLITANLGDFFSGASKVRLKLLEAFRKNNINIPYETLEIIEKH